MVLRLLTRRECSLCDDAARLLTDLGLEFEAVDIDSDEALRARYAGSIPVVLAGEREVARAPITRRSLEKALEALRGDRRPGAWSRLRG